ncbi:hypothetical protein CHINAEXTREME_09385 [Halobiforma lacisalsi AJ5]|uniref:Uncharacterized protein n=1 Tax=Natronobacterium lacisalsi AJ5 TaxID=358396 RepID=M0L4N9_NATLA|nr:hypothetical protein [Halobiforma lacisalsi]APW97977.1 hypothetical protein CHINAEXTREME_09385 [Halobiforma lacisalsi AJ5]EMA28532.1 hypothetical protein C445_17946 [Halobiforma lacisalsi AJ5]
MSGRDTVTELHVDGTLCVDVPVDRGDELAVGAADALESIDVVRFADVLELGEVDAGDEGLAVAVDCRLTLHLDEPLGEEKEEGFGSRVRERLTSARGTDSCCTFDVDRFEVVDGPYVVGTW